MQTCVESHKLRVFLSDSGLTFFHQRPQALGTRKKLPSYSNHIAHVCVDKQVMLCSWGPMHCGLVKRRSVMGGGRCIYKMHFITQSKILTTFQKQKSRFRVFKKHFISNRSKFSQAPHPSRNLEFWLKYF